MEPGKQPPQQEKGKQPQAEQPNQRFLRTQDFIAFKNDLNEALNNYLTEQLGKNTEELLNRMNEMLKNYNGDDTSTEYDEDQI